MVVEEEALLYDMTQGREGNLEEREEDIGMWENRKACEVRKEDWKGLAVWEVRRRELGLHLDLSMGYRGGQRVRLFLVSAIWRADFETTPEKKVVFSILFFFNDTQKNKNLITKIKLYF